MKLKKYNNINLAELEDNQVLFFVRIRGKKNVFNHYYPEEFLKSFSKLKMFRTISEYRVGDIHIDINLINIYDITNKQHILFDKLLDIQDIIIRCRGLREISYSESKSLILRTAKFFDEYFLKHRNLKLIVSLIVDNYVMDVMVRMAKYYQVEVIQLVGFFIPGYVRFTDKGIGIKVRDVKGTEVLSVINRLELKKESHFATGKLKSIKRAIIDYISYKYRYIIRYLLKYKVLGRLEYEYRFAKYFKGFNKISKLSVNKYYDSFTKIKKTSVFIPLHYHPEATVDYWSDKPENADYLGSLLPVISFYREMGVQVVFKEHPAYYLRRSIEFYKVLKAYDNVIIIEPFSSSQSIVELVDKVCIHTGSVGLESLMLDKHVYKITENYYSFGFIPKYDQLHKPYKLLSKKEKIYIIKRILETTLPTN